MADFEKFIHDLAYQLNLSLMDDSQRARLNDYNAKGTATKDQASWDPGAPLPNPADVAYDITTNADWEGLYKLFQDTLYSLNSERKGLNKYHKDVEDFLNKFYGAGKCISPFEASSDVTSILTTTKADDFATYLGTIRAFLESNDIASNDTDKLIKKLRDGSYKNDKSVLEILSAVCARIINYETELTTRGYAPTLSTTELNTLYEKSTQARPATATELDDFRTNYTDMVKTIVTKPEVFKAFSSKDQTRIISYSIDTALARSNYTDPNNANYLEPLYKDRKRFWQRAKDNVNSWTRDHFAKWRSRHERHNYSTNASFIVSEIIKAKIKPTDGLDKILGKADSIKAKLPPKAKKEFDYLVKVLKKLSPMKAFKEATKDGAQMRHIVQEVIKDAVHNGKIDEAKVVLETLAMVRYGASTSSVRDKLKEANKDFKLFSDEGLSFNQGPIKTFTAALDKTIKGAGILAFETANLIKNKLIRQKGLKFKEGTKRLNDSIKKSSEYGDPTKRAQMEKLFAFWDFVNSSISKDYNIFKKHSKVQKAMTTIPTGSTTRPIDDMFDDFYTTHSIGR